VLANVEIDPEPPVIYAYDLFQDERDGYSAKLLKSWYGEKDVTTDSCYRVPPTPA
jgi:hypothetical protein